MYYAHADKAHLNLAARPAGSQAIASAIPAARRRVSESSANLPNAVFGQKEEECGDPQCLSAIEKMRLA